MTCSLCGRASQSLTSNGLCDDCSATDESTQRPADAEDLLSSLAAAEGIEEVSEILESHKPPFESMERAVLREKILKVLKGKVLSPAKIADAWLGTGQNEGEKIVEAQAGILTELALENAVLFHDPGQEAYATILIAGHRENYHIRGRTFAMWLRKLWFDRYKELTSSESPGSLDIADLVMPGPTTSPAPQAQAVRDAVA